MSIQVALNTVFHQIPRVLCKGQGEMRELQTNLEGFVVGLFYCNE